MNAKRLLLTLCPVLAVVFVLLAFNYKDVDAVSSPGRLLSDVKADLFKEKVNLKAVEEIYDGLDYESVIEKYAPTLPEGFSITRFQYFAVFSNLDNELTYNLIDKDIRNAVAAMEDNYIEVKPEKVTAVFLFEDQDTYSDFALSNFDIRRDDLSPYGFYKISKNVIVVRYVSWKGSLPHEVTHALIQSDFPGVPSWFNEGMGAMHERATYKNGELVADFNWRIRALRRSFNEGTYTDLRTLMSTNDDDIYGRRSSFYYAQARYLLGMLQEKGMLARYYKHFNNSFESDNTGITQLETIYGKKLDEIEKEYVAYVKSFKEE
jgi:hypothetical protein